MPAVDTNLILDEGRTVTADETEVFVECEGGFYALAHLKMGAMTGTTPTLDTTIEQSPDLGTTYYYACKFVRFNETHDNAYVKQPVYIPQPNTSGNKVRVRIKYDVGGTTPSYVVTKAWLEPLLSLGTPQTDEDLQEGLAYQGLAV